MRILIHTIRLSMIAGIIGCLFYTTTTTPDRRSVSLTTIPLQIIQKSLPTAVGFGEPSRTVQGAVELTNNEGRRVGYCFQTSPVGDRVIGFSGPSNLLLVCDQTDSICGISVLSSTDTRDHVLSVQKDDAFWGQFLGKTLDDVKHMSLKPWHATAGATLTSHAMVESIGLRLGRSEPSGRFTTDPTLADIQNIFPQAKHLRVDAGDTSVTNVYDREHIPIGWTLRTSPVADSLIGYQGPTDTLIGFDPAGHVVGLSILKSFDNEPYVGYVRDDRAFGRHFIGQTFESLASTTEKAPSTEGVSGATMTSQAIAQAIVTASQATYETQATRSLGHKIFSRISTIETPQWGAIFVIACGLVVGFTHLRGHWLGRIAFPIVAFAYLGFGSGALLSQAQLWGWAAHGVPQAAPVLLLLSIIAILTPATSGRNVYCTQLCAHGSAQQLLKIAIPQRHAGITYGLRKRITPILKKLHILPWMLFILCLLLTVFNTPVSLVDLEPFDAYLPTIAGPAAISIFIGSLVLSVISPMAYCRHACPTGAFLNFIRLNRNSSKITWHDIILCGCLFLALLNAWSSGDLGQ